jgi:hypothetical protein
MFEVRKNCEYVAEIEAKDEDEALRLVAGLKDEDWSEAWSPVEVEEM